MPRKWKINISFELMYMATREREKIERRIDENISEEIEILSPLNIMEIITKKNSHSCKEDSAIIEGTYNHVFWTPYVVLNLDLV